MVKQNSKKTASLVKNNNRRRKNTKKHTIAYGKAELKDDHIAGDKIHRLIWLKQNLLLTTILVKSKQSCQVKQTLMFKSRKADWVTGENQPITETEGVKQQI